MSNLLNETLFLAGSGVNGTEHTPPKQKYIKIPLAKAQCRQLIVRCIRKYAQFSEH